MSQPFAPPSADRPRHPAAWHPDPVRGGTGWRWWDGSTWTTFTEAVAYTPQEGSKPRLARWWSVPVVVCAPLVAIGLVVLAILEPIAALAGLAPLAIVLPVISWFDRVEPEPRASRVHALLWGATVAVLISVILNTVVALVGGDVLAMVLSAPVVEEAAKGVGIVWAVRRREVDGVSDGVVYAMWVALGFAVVEDMTYFAVASVDGSLLVVFVLRALLTPFAHPLFTFWTGLAVGRAVAHGSRLWPYAIWGYLLAVGTHMAWNGSLAIGSITTDIDEDVATTVLLVAMLLFVALFVAVGVAVVRMRRRQQREFIAAVPDLVLRYHVPPDEAASFASWSSLLHSRRQLPRRARSAFDAVHANLARLALLRAGGETFDSEREQVLAAQLTHARERLRVRR